MSSGIGNLAFTDDRRDQREEVHYRTRALDSDARPVTLLIVNISAQGLMARCDREFAVGERIEVTLPRIGAVAAEVRWSLGGRLGCQFDRVIDLASYYELIAVLVKAK